MSGNVTIEFGLVILFMAALGFGALDFGRLGYQKVAITNAARAGVQYGAQDLVTASDTAGMIQATRNDIGDTNNLLAINARRYCGCPGCSCPGQSPDVPSCNVICDDGTFSLMYVEVTATDQVGLLLAYPGIASPQSVASTSTMRVR